MIFTFNDAGPRDEKQIAGADANVIDLEGSGQMLTESLSPSHFFRPQKHLNFRSVFLQFFLLPMFVGSADKSLKQRMRLERLRFEFRMKLASDEIRMIGNLNHLDVRAV